MRNNIEDRIRNLKQSNLFEIRIPKKFFCLFISTRLETKQHESEKDKFKTTRTISRATYKHSMKYYLIFIVGFHILVVMNKILMWYFVNFRCQWNVISKCSPTGRTTPRRKEVSLLDSPIIMTMRWYERQPPKNSSTNEKFYLSAIYPWNL